MPTHIEVIDRTCGEKYQTQIAKYQNSYRLESNNPFKLESMEKLVEATVSENFQNFHYDTQESVKICNDTAVEIRKKIQAFKFDRYKIVVVVSVIEKTGQSLDVSMGLLWDKDRDRYITHTHEGNNFYAYCCVLALYYE